MRFEVDREREREMLPDFFLFVHFLLFFDFDIFNVFLFNYVGADSKMGLSFPLIIETGSKWILLEEICNFYIPLLSLH